MLFAVAEAVFFDLAVDGPREEMKDRGPAHVVAHGGVTLLQEPLRKRRRAFPIAGIGESAEPGRG